MNCSKNDFCEKEKIVKEDVKICNLGENTWAYGHWAWTFFP